MTDGTGCVALVSASTRDLALSRPSVGFGIIGMMLALCCPSEVQSNYKLWM